MFYLMIRKNKQDKMKYRSLSKRVRECSMKHYNYVVTDGDEELKNHLLWIREREKKEIIKQTLDSFKEELQKELSRNVE